MNIMGRLVMRPPILLVRYCIYLFHFSWGPLVSYREAFYCLLGDPLGEASLGFIFLWLLSFTSCFYPLGL
jgi:hypothetical protein